MLLLRCGMEALTSDCSGAFPWLVLTSRLPHAMQCNAGSIDTAADEDVGDRFDVTIGCGGNHLDCL